MRYSIFTPLEAGVPNATFSTRFGDQHENQTVILENPDNLDCHGSHDQSADSHQQSAGDYYRRACPIYCPCLNGEHGNSDASSVWSDGPVRYLERSVTLFHHTPPTHPRNKCVGFFF